MCDCGLSVSAHLADPCPTMVWDVVVHAQIPDPTTTRRDYRPNLLYPRRKQIELIELDQNGKNGGFAWKVLRLCGVKQDLSRWPKATSTSCG